MSELAATAERLRLVKDACIDFITLWAVDRMMEENRLSDWIHMDVQSAAVDPGNVFTPLHSNRFLDD